MSEKGHTGLVSRLKATGKVEGTKLPKPRNGSDRFRTTDLSTDSPAVV